MVAKSYLNETAGLKNTVKMTREINERLNNMKLGEKHKISLHKLNPEDIVKPHVKGTKSREL